MLKATSGGYDGKGVWICDNEGAAADVLAHGLSLIAEEYVPFDRELAVLVARSPTGQGAAFPVAQTIQEDGICREVIAPAPGLAPALATAAQRAGLIIAAELGVTGLLAVELFALGGELIVNELAMRPHNCGHWTIDAARTSQFEQHLRAVLDLPLGTTTMTSDAAVMVNVLGGADPDLHSRLVHVMAADPGVKVHLYGKAVRPGRKVGLYMAFVVFADADFGCRVDTDVKPEEGKHGQRDDRDKQSNSLLLPEVSGIFRGRVRHTTFFVRKEPHRELLGC